MSSMVMPLQYRLIAVLLLVLAAAACGYVRGLQHEGMARDVAAAKAEAAAWSSFADLLQRNAESDRNHYKELRRLQGENNSLRDCVERGRCGLRVAAVCPARAAGTGAGAGVDNGIPPELDPAARPAYFALRDGITLQRQQLMACQARLLNQQER